MEKLYINDKEFITYRYVDNGSKYDFIMLYLHGFYSSMNTTKSLLMEKIAKEYGISFLSLTYLGFGDSSGKAADYSIKDWFNNIKLVLNKFSNKKLFIFGHSMGGWLSFLTALEYKDRMKYLIAGSSAIDFFERQALPLVREEEWNKKMVAIIPDTDTTSPQKIITRKMIEEARDYNLWNKNNLTINCPLRMVHATDDDIIPCETSIKFFSKINCNNARLTILKGFDHNLKSEEAMQFWNKMIRNSLEEIINI